MKRSSKISLAGTTLILCMCLVCFLYVNSSLFIRNHILPLISGEIGETVQAERISFSVFSGIKLENARIGADKPILTAQALEINYQVRPLLEGKLQIDLLDAQNVTIDCGIERGLLIMNRIRKRLMSQAPKLNVSELRITAPKVRIHGKHQGLSGALTFTKLDIEGANIGNQEALILKISTGADVEIQNELVELHPITLQLQGQFDDNFQLPKLTAKGRVECLKGDLLDVDLSPHAVDFAITGSFLDECIRIEKSTIQAFHGEKKYATASIEGSLNTDSSGELTFDVHLPNSLFADELRPAIQRYGAAVSFDSLHYTGSIAAEKGLASVKLTADMATDGLKLGTPQAQQLGPVLSVTSQHAVTVSPKTGKLKIEQLMAQVSTQAGDSLCSLRGNGDLNNFNMELQLPDISVFKPLLPTSLISNLQGNVIVDIIANMKEKKVAIHGGIKANGLRLTVPNIAEMATDHTGSIQFNASCSYDGIAQLHSMTSNLTGPDGTVFDARTSAQLILTPRPAPGSTVNLEFTQINLERVRQIISPRIAIPPIHGTCALTTTARLGADQTVVLEADGRVDSFNISPGNTNLFRVPLATTFQGKATGSFSTKPPRLNSTELQAAVSFDAGKKAPPSPSGVVHESPICRIQAKGNGTTFKLEAHVPQLTALQPLVPTGLISELKGRSTATIDCDIASNKLNARGSVDFADFTMMAPEILDISDAHNAGITFNAATNTNQNIEISNIRAKLTKTNGSNPLVELDAHALLQPTESEWAKGEFAVRRLDLAQALVLFPRNKMVSKLEGLMNLRGPFHINKKGTFQTDLKGEMERLNFSLKDTGGLTSPVNVSFAGSTALAMNTRTIQLEKFKTEVTHENEPLLELESSAIIPLPSLSPIKLATVVQNPVNVNHLLEYWEPVDPSALPSSPQRAPLPETTISLQAKQVDYNKLSAAEVDIRLRTAGTTAIVDPSTCTLNGAPVQFNAELGLGRPGIIDYTLNGSGTQLPLDTLSKCFPAHGKAVPVRVEGIIQSGEVELSGRFVDFKTLLANMRGKTDFELGPCRVAEFKGPYKKAFEMLMRAYVYTLKTEDLKFSDGHGKLSFDGYKLSFEELKLNSEQIGVRFHGDVTLGEEKIIPDIYLQANLSKENTKRIGRFIYVQPQPDGRSLTNEIRLSGDIEKLSTMAVIIATFVVKPEYREMTETVLTTGFDKASDIGTLLKGIGEKLGFDSDEPEKEDDE